MERNLLNLYQKWKKNGYDNILFLSLHDKYDNKKIMDIKEFVLKLNHNMLKTSQTMI